MSIMRSILNTWLRAVERPRLARAKGEVALRRSFETKAKLFFRAPFGTVREDKTVNSIPTRFLNTGQTDGPLIIYLHGGGYVFGSPRTHDALIATLCKKAGAHAVVPDYRKAPEHPHPAALEDALTSYLSVLEAGHSPSNIVIGGDSAGGGLALALVAELIALKHPLPAGVFAFSPLTDMTFSGASVTKNADKDVVLPASRISDMATAFLADADPRDPRASPLFAEFTGGPPVWLTVGDTEFLMNDTTRMAERLEAQGVRVSMVVEHDLPHVWPMFHNFLPEAHKTMAMLADWITQQTNDAPDS